MTKRYKNDSAFDFETYEDEIEETSSTIDVHTLHELHQIDYDDEVERELKDIYGDCDGC